MDEYRESLAACYTLDNLMDAAHKCAQKTRFKAQVQLFMLNLLTECAELQDAVLGGTWRPCKGQTFRKVERGKPRVITPRDMRTRVVERCLCDHVLEPFIRSQVIEDCSACLQGRGLTYAIDRVRAHLEDAPPGAWVMQYDYHDYFGHIDRSAALSRMAPHLQPDVLAVVSACIGGPGIGLDLGSHVSQMLATWYATPLDLHALSQPGLVGYHRHMDDGLAVFAGRDAAFDALASFVETSEAMGLEMNPKKTHVNRASHPHVYCGKRFQKKGDRVKVNVPKKKGHANIRHVCHVIEKSADTPIDLVPVMASSAGYLDSGDAILSPRLHQGLPQPPRH